VKLESYIRLGAVIVVSAILLVSCVQRESDLDSGRLINRTDLPGFKGDDVYAEVKVSALPALYDTYRSSLSSLGMPKAKWDKRFDCNHLADMYIAAAQVKFAISKWHKKTDAQGLAMAVIWFTQDKGGNHAIVEIKSDTGTLYVDPSIGPDPIKLSAKEINSIYFRKW
jgi:hypothetical protein